MLQNAVWLTSDYCERAVGFQESLVDIRERPEDGRKDCTRCGRLVTQPTCFVEASSLTTKTQMRKQPDGSPRGGMEDEPTRTDNMAKNGTDKDSDKRLQRCSCGGKSRSDERDPSQVANHSAEGPNPLEGLLKKWKDKRQRKKEKEIETLLLERRQLHKRWRKATTEEKAGLKVLWNEVKQRLAKLRRADRIRRRRKRKEKERKDFFRNPYKFARQLLDEKRSGSLNISKEELEQHMKAVHSDKKRWTSLGSPGYIPLPPSPRMCCTTQGFTTGWQQLEIGIAMGCAISPILFVTSFEVILTGARQVARGLRTSTGERLPALRAYMDDITTMLQTAPCTTRMLKRLDELTTWARGEEIPRLVDQPIRSLGRDYTADLSDKQAGKVVQKQLVEGLAKIDQSQLAGKHKTWCYQFVLFQRLMWPLKMADVPSSLVNKMEGIANNYIRRWLGLPRCFSDTGLYGKNVLQIPLKSIRLGVPARKSSYGT
ncbi:hypothetical protein WMY93_006657 [Mugilogobius chulae]|uniref:Reverse transcriptase domain-containing protein n=1 Tax=Mugilogobius chulae TaxID=88201 RepID=A0AAW0PKV6_9GOBI